MQLILPAKCNDVEFLPWVSRQLMFSDVTSLWTLAKMPFLAASNSAELPLNKSATSLSESLTNDKGVWPSRFFFVSSAPCYNILNK